MCFGQVFHEDLDLALHGLKPPLPWCGIQVSGLLPPVGDQEHQEKRQSRASLPLPHRGDACV